MLLLIIIMIMHMQSKLYTIPFFSPPHDQFTVSPQAVIVEPQTRIFENFSKLPKKPKLLEKFKLPDKSRFELMEMRSKKDSCPPSNPHS